MDTPPTRSPWGHWKQLLATRTPGETIIVPCESTAECVRSAAYRLGLRIKMKRMGRGCTKKRLTILSP